MRVGILSLTSGYNFGGTLQAVALFRMLEKLGHDPVVINYWPVPPQAEVPWWKNWGILRKGRMAHAHRRFCELRHLGGFKERYDSFKRRELRWTERCTDRDGVERALRSLDAVVVGSDQVWNILYHPDPIFQLHGLDAFRGLRVAYAACCGNPAQDCPPWAPRALPRFHAVGVRNEFTADWVRRCTSGAVAPQVVCDPTLLIDEYPRVKLELPDRYIAAYHIGDADAGDQRRMVKALRKRCGDLPVVCLMATATRIRMAEWHDITLWHLNPFEWVEAIRRASFVLTDSYHAILFSLRYRVPFLATYSEQVRAPRLIELRDALGLTTCIVSSNSSSPIGGEPDWHLIENEFRESRQYSEGFLRKSFNYPPFLPRRVLNSR